MAAPNDTTAAAAATTTTTLEDKEEEVSIPSTTQNAPTNIAISTARLEDMGDDENLPVVYTTEEGLFCHNPITGDKVPTKTITMENGKFKEVWKIREVFPTNLTDEVLDQGFALCIEDCNATHDQPDHKILEVLEKPSSHRNLGYHKCNFCATIEELESHLLTLTDTMAQCYDQVQMLAWEFNTNSPEHNARRPYLYKLILQKSNLLPNLNELCVRFPIKNVDNLQATFLQSIGNPYNIKRIDIDTDLVKTATALGRFQQLEELESSNDDETHGPSKGFFEELAKSLWKMPKLRKLEFKILTIKDGDPGGCLELIYSALGSLNRPNNNDVPEIELGQLCFLKPDDYDSDSDSDDDDDNDDDDWTWYPPISDYDYLHTFLTDGPPFLLAIQQAERCGIIPEERDDPLLDDKKWCSPEQGCLEGGYRYDGNLQPWLHAMCTIRCREEDRLNLVYFFLRQLEYNQDELDLLCRLPSVILIQKRRTAAILIQKLKKEQQLLKELTQRPQEEGRIGW